MELLTSNNINEKIKEIVKEAKESVLIASAWIKSGLFNQILDIIGDKTKNIENLNFQIVFRASELRDLLITDEAILKKMKDAKASIYICNRLHAKFVVVDNKKAIVGSANFTTSGLSDIESGNIEAGVFYEEKEEVNKLSNYFEEITNHYSKELKEDLIGFILNPSTIQHFDLIVFEEDLPIETYIEIEHKNGKVLAKIVDIKHYDMGFFTNPFESNNYGVFAPINDFKTIFSENKDKEWRKAASFAYKNGNGNSVRIARANVIGIVKDDKIDMLKTPLEVGSAVYRASKDTLDKLLKTKLSGSVMGFPIQIGKLIDSSIDVFIDGDEVLNKHMLIIGSTGSGKSYFTKHFISQLVNEACERKPQVFIFDPHGEYYDSLKDNINEELIDHICFDDVLVPAEPDDIEELISGVGYGELISGNSNAAKNNKSKILKYISKLRQDFMNNKQVDNLRDLLVGMASNDNIGTEIIDSIISVYSEKYIENQRGVFDKINNAINSLKPVVILNLKNVYLPKNRTNIVGLFMQKALKINKENPNNRKLLVLEEAHNFAPEKGYGDSSSGKDNISLTLSRAIASEGRKFNIGLIVITQRPAQVSKYVLSQMNTQVVFRTINDSDLKAISTLIEYVGEESIKSFPNLSTGVGMVSGVGVRMSILFRCS